jgi:hypothetical protein
MTEVDCIREARSLRREAAGLERLATKRIVPRELADRLRHAASITERGANLWEQVAVVRQQLSRLSAL